MTAPPPQMPLFTESHLHAPFLSPASTTSDSTFSWVSMPPLQTTPRPSQTPTSPPANESHEDKGSLLWITGNTPDELRSKRNMTKVRRKAMGSYLEKGKRTRSNQDRPRLRSEESSVSRESIGSDQQDTVDAVISNSEALKIFRGETRRTGRRAASPTPSSASSANHQKAQDAEAQVAKVQQPFLLPSAPIVVPMRTNIPLPYDDTVPRPFQSIGKPLDPFRTMFQAHHPSISVEQLKWHCSRSFGTKAMGLHWIPALVKSPHAFLSTLCIASAHYDALQNLQTESVQTLALRQEVIHLIGQNLVNPTSRIDDSNIIALTQLIASEIISAEDTALSYHENGVEAMISQRGGLNQLGVKGRLGSTISWVSLQSAILREAKPRSLYSDFCASKSSNTYANTATAPESPIYSPRENFETLRRSTGCAQQTLDLLKDMRMMLELFVHEGKQSRLNTTSLRNLYKKIATQYPSASELKKPNVLTSSDWRYESIRLAAIVQATAIIKRIRLSEALQHAAESHTPSSLYIPSAASRSSESLISPANLRSDSPMTSFSTSPSYATSPAFSQSNPFASFSTRPSVSSAISTSDFSFLPTPSASAHAPRMSAPDSLLQTLKTALQNSDLSECWGDMAGVLLWVALTVGAASRTGDKVLRKWFSALATRVSITLCFEHPEAIHATMLRMTEVMEGLGYASGSGASAGGEVVRRDSLAVAIPPATASAPAASAPANRKGSPKRRRV